jgi:hypothetical protein
MPEILFMFLRVSSEMLTKRFDLLKILFLAEFSTWISSEYLLGSFLFF